ncbi:MAG TPA: helix-turn-helix domain-containing protein [Planctomycetia bacterium]|nr:helix-turn-helix domain-containing protein [Planctomycetia bacterium]
MPTTPHYHWTAELLAKGFGVAETAEIRRLDAAVVLEHALAAAKAGRRIPWSAFKGFAFPPESKKQLEALKALVENEAGPAVRESLF